MARAEARDGLAALVDGDLAALATPAASADRAPPHLVVTVLAPELKVTIGGTPVPPPRGHPAKLLAVLIASSGVMTIDAAIEALWPGADPDVGRNRLHGVMLRLRRGLGLPTGGPISCGEGVVRMERAVRHGRDRRMGVRAPRRRRRRARVRRGRALQGRCAQRPVRL